MRTVQHGSAGAVIALALTGCAASPESIKPAYVSDSQFAYMNCAQLAAYKVTLTGVYVQAANSEEDEGTLDAATFLLLPVGTMTYESLPFQISDLKGRIAAIEGLQARGNCDARHAITMR